MEVLVVVPARAGSKGITGKNTRLLGGKPLIQYTLETARQLVPKHQIMLSTDSLEIAALANSLGIDTPFLRPAELATDEAGMLPVVQHALEQYKRGNGRLPGVVLLLQPTSPFRQVKQIKEAMALFTPGVDMVVSVKQTKANPYFLLFEEDSGGWLKKLKSLPTEIVRRQDAPPVYELNGAIYLLNPALTEKARSFTDFTNMRKYEMDSLSSVDLDSELDWEFAEFLISRNFL